MLGNALASFIALADSKRLTPLGEYLNTRGLGGAFDPTMFEIAVAKLAQVRPDPAQKENNEIDAMSLAIIKCANSDSSHSDSFFTAITRSRQALVGFYAAIDSEIDSERSSGGESLLSMARSSISMWLSANVEKAAGEMRLEYVQRGIELTDELLGISEQVRSSLAARTPPSVPVPSREVAASKRIEGQMWGLLEHYETHYRTPVFRPIEKHGRQERDEAEEVFSAEEVANILTPATFQEAMRCAREKLGEAPQDVVQRVQPYVRDAWSLRIGGEALETRVSNILRDFERDVY